MIHDEQYWYRAGVLLAYAMCGTETANVVLVGAGDAGMIVGAGSLSSVMDSMQVLLVPSYPSSVPPDPSFVPPYASFVPPYHSWLQYNKRYAIPGTNTRVPHYYY
eukprot:3940385-Rhodomonas_salina.1